MNDEMREERLKEILNRLHYVIELHPYLSGLMTNEYQRTLHVLAENLFTGRQVGLFWKPEEPRWDLEIDDFERSWMETQEK